MNNTKYIFKIIFYRFTITCVFLFSFLKGQTVADTLSYDYLVNDSFDLYFGEIGLVVHKMPVDGIIKQVNFPIASWGDSSGAILVEMYKLNYPLDSTGNQYDPVYFDENGWLGYYPNQVNDSLLIPYIPYWNSNPVWNSFGDRGVCTGRSPVPNTFPPLYELIWYGDFAPATLDPYNSSIGDNWIFTADLGTEYEFNRGDYIGIFIKHVYGDTISPISFFAGYDTGLNDPWRFLLFSPQCSGPSGEGGWHIRSETVNCELEIEYTELAINQNLNMPVSIDLHQNYPNPFNPVTQIKFGLSEKSLVSIIIHDIFGKEIKSIYFGDSERGQHTITWDGKNNSNEDVSSGIYFYTITANSLTSGEQFVDTKKMVLVR